MRSATVTALITAVSVLLAACDRAPEKPGDDSRQEPVVVYAAFEDDAQLRDLFAAYTEQTGVMVIVRRGEAKSIVNDVIENRISPPADVLMTRSVTDVWRAAEEGALRPMFSVSAREQLPAWSRDPDDLWLATGYRTAVVVHAMEDLGNADLPDFASLAEPRFRKSLCLSSSANKVNSAVIAMMIEAMGVRPAEIAVRGWIANLALPVFDTEAQLIDAIRSGSCRIGIASSSAIARAQNDDSKLEVSLITPATTYADVDGIGVARHARNPEGAIALVYWLFSKDVQEALALQNRTYPANGSAQYDRALDASGPDNVSPRNVGLVAWHAVAAAKLAERARYR